MKQSQQLIGMPIISIMDGKEIGKVKSLLINPDVGAVDFFIVHNDQWTLGIKVLPFRHVKGLGDYAIMTESESSVIDLSEDALAGELRTKSIQIIGSRVITTAGRLLGQITEYYVSDRSGKIEGCLVEIEGEQPKVLGKDFIITIGKEIIIASDEGVANLRSQDEFKNGMAERAEKLEEMQESRPQSLSAVPVQSTYKEQILGFKDELNLTGKKLTTDLYDERGELILPEGEVVTKEVVERVKSMGRNKLVELTLKIAE